MNNYKTFVKNNRLYFTITKGQFKGVTYCYNMLKENNNLSYQLSKKYKNIITDNNKFLFEQEIKKILQDKLKHV